MMMMNGAQPGGVLEEESPSSSVHYSAVHDQATDQAYRASPHQQHHHLHHPPPSMSHAPMLPPIQHFEAQNMQQPPYMAPPLNGSQMPPHAHHSPQYAPPQFPYAANGMQPMPMPSNAGASGQNGMLRFPIPPQAPVQMGGGRPKKDIKRRTKTGCLTCRKRRIKCDEGHPTCRNCLKSKRECMGYDPIFKQQPAPAPIQPAPSSAGSASAKSSISTPLPSNPYQQHPQPHPYQPATASPFIPTHHNPVQAVDGPFEYGASLDPALASGDASLTMAANSFSTILQPERKAKHVTMDQLFSLNDVPPRYMSREAPPPNSTLPQQEVDEFFKFHYAIGLDRLFETSWYGSRGLAHLRHDPPLLDFVMQAMEQMKSRAEDLSAVQNLQSLEARLVWQLALMPRSASLSNGANGTMADQLTLDLLPRIDTVENLLTGQFLSHTKIPGPPTAEHQHVANFWHQLGRFVAARDDTSDPNALRDINDALATMRNNLGMMENRDVLYSLAIARHIGGRLLEFNPPQPVIAPTDDMHNDVKKLQVAQEFISMEDQKGTTQVIQRICGMAIRGWILQKQ